MLMTGDIEETELYLAWLHKRARDKVNSWWFAIEAVAAELLQQSVLSGSTVHKLVQQAEQDRVLMAQTARRQAIQAAKEPVQ